MVFHRISLPRNLAVIAKIFARHTCTCAFTTSRIDLQDTSIPCIRASERSGDLKPIGLSLLCAEGPCEPTVGPLLTEGVCNVACRRSFVCSRWTRAVCKRGEGEFAFGGLSNYSALSASLATSSASNNCSRRSYVTPIVGNECNYTWNRLWGPMYLRLHTLMTNVAHTRHVVSHRKPLSHTCGTSYHWIKRSDPLIPHVNSLKRSK